MQKWQLYFGTHTFLKWHYIMHIWFWLLKLKPRLHHEQKSLYRQIDFSAAVDYGKSLNNTTGKTFDTAVIGIIAPLLLPLSPNKFDICQIGWDQAD